MLQSLTLILSTRYMRDMIEMRNEWARGSFIHIAIIAMLQCCWQWPEPIVCSCTYYDVQPSATWALSSRENKISKFENHVLFISDDALAGGKVAITLALWYCAGALPFYEICCMHTICCIGDGIMSSPFLGLNINRLTDFVFLFTFC